METIDLGDGLQVSCSVGKFVFTTDAYACLELSRDGEDSMWQIHTGGKWFVTKTDIDQMIKALQYVKEAVE